MCANLPYVCGQADLPSEVRAQPATALFAADGGAALVSRLLAEAPRHLSHGGRLLAEIDAAILPALQVPFTGHKVHRDLDGRERVLEAWS